MLDTIKKSQRHECKTMLDYNFPQVQLKYVLESKFKYEIRGEKDAYNFILSLYDKDAIAHREFFFVLFLNRANHVCGYFKASEGGIAGTVVDGRTIFQAALLSNASSYILSHNHPSGNLKPSMQDITITNKIKEGGLILGFTLIDHIIVTPFGEYYSFANQGVL